MKKKKKKKRILTNLNSKVDLLTDFEGVTLI